MARSRRPGGETRWAARKPARLDIPAARGHRSHHRGALSRLLFPLPRRRSFLEHSARKARSRATPKLDSVCRPRRANPCACEPSIRLATSRIPWSASCTRLLVRASGVPLQKSWTPFNFLKTQEPKTAGSHRRLKTGTGCQFLARADTNLHTMESNVPFAGK